MRRLAFAAAFALLASPAFAGVEQCTEPYGPVVPTDASTVTKEQLAELKAEVLQFIADSDSFQTCMVQVMDNTDKDEALTPAQKAAAQRSIDSNQKEKEAIGAAYNALVKAVAARGN